MKYPFVRQRGEKDCGPASVLMILKYYGGYISLEKLSEILCVNKKGTTFYHMVLALKSFGFNSDGYKYEDIYSIKTPFIAHTHHNSYNHYVVIWKISKDKILIGDPSRGNIKADLKEFLPTWTGNVITALPQGKIVNEGKPKLLKFLCKLIKPYINYIFLIGILSIISVIFSFILSISVQIVIKYYSLSALHIISFFTIVTILNLIVSYVRNNILIMFGQKLEKSLSKKVYNHIIDLPYSASRRKTTGEIVSYFNDLLLIKDTISKSLISLFIDLPIILIIFFYLINFKHYLFVMSLILLLLYAVAYFSKRNQLYYLTDETLRNKAIINSYITESISGIETVHNLVVFDRFKKKFKEKYLGYYQIKNTYEKKQNKMILSLDSISYISNLCVLIYGIFNLNKNLTISSFLTIYVLLTLLNNSLKNILNFGFELKDILSSLNHIYDLFGGDKKNMIKIDGDIEMYDLKFSYDKVNPVLRGINLNIKKGSKLFVTGKSGSGKSTLFKLVKGYYKGYDGSVSIGGVEVKNYIFKNVIYISSSETLFTGKISDNLSIKKYDSFNNKICEVDTLDDLLVSENGSNFSQGQRQRIALARALINFDILIIDEGLSDTDINMERRIIKNLFLACKDKTIIFISHRLDNLDLFERFIKIEEGKIILDEIKAN